MTDLANFNPTSLVRGLSPIVYEAVSVL